MTLLKMLPRLAASTMLSVVFIISMASSSTMAQESVGAGAVANRVVLPTSTHPATKVATDLGRVEGNAAMDRMILVLAGSAGADQATQELLNSLHTKGSPRYHQWLTPEEFAVESGAAPEPIQ